MSSIPTIYDSKFLGGLRHICGCESIAPFLWEHSFLFTTLSYPDSILRSAAYSVLKYSGSSENRIYLGSDNVMDGHDSTICAWGFRKCQHLAARSGGDCGYNSKPEELH